MAIICHDIQLLFIMTPRTACTAIGKLLFERFGGEYIPAQSLIDNQGNFIVRKKHSTLTDLIQHNLINQSIIDDYFKVATVRNPFDSLVSLYVKKRESYASQLDDPKSWVHSVPGYVEDMKFCQTHSFDDWIAKTFAPPTFKRFLNRGKQSLFDGFTSGVNQVMRFEQVQSNLQSVLQEIGVKEEFEIPKINQTQEKIKAYRDYYTPRSRATIEYVFSKDIATYGYQF
ncbi:MAG: sulfotransferase family 2 domain-containing protein [Cyanobacteria bacterium P01_A01_bin.123]